MARNALASRDSVIAALGSSITADAATLDWAIGQASRLVYSTIQRPYLFRRVYSETYDGRGINRLMLRNWPVLSVDSLSSDGVSIAAAKGFGYAGYRMEAWDGLPPGNPQMLTLNNATFGRGSGNVEVIYAAGYVVQEERKTVPSGANYALAVDAPHGSWAVDEGVTYANGGQAFSKVPSSPAQGQYAVAGGVYSFNPADAGQLVLISYSFIPADIESAVASMAAGAISLGSEGLSGNIKMLKSGDATIERFGAGSMNADTKALLQSYKSVVM